MTAGCSATPLAAKLGIKPGLRAWLADMPASVRVEIGADTVGLVEITEPEPRLDYAHVFTTERTVLAARLAMLRPLLALAGMLWVSWPKKAAQVPTDITEDVVRAEALPLGFVDVKVCAVDAVWSGLKLVIRRGPRQ